KTFAPGPRDNSVDPDTKASRLFNQIFFTSFSRRLRRVAMASSWRNRTAFFRHSFVEEIGVPDESEPGSDIEADTMVIPVKWILSPISIWPTTPTPPAKVTFSPTTVLPAIAEVAAIAQFFPRRTLWAI